MNFRILISFIICLISYNSVAQDKLDAFEVSDNLYAIENHQGGNIAFLVTRKGVVVVDAGATPAYGKDIINTIQSVTRKPIKYLILTHMHSDHVNGVVSFPKNVTIIAHSNLEQNNNEFNKKNLENYIQEVFPNYLNSLKTQMDSITDKENDAYKALLEKYNTNLNYFEDIKKVKFRKPDITFTDYYKLKLSNERIMLEYTGPGHTNDNIVVKFSNHNVIHTGDLVFRKSFPYTIDAHGVDIYNWVQSLDDLYKENIYTVIPGHGEVDNKYALKEQSEYFKKLAQKVERLKNQGLSLDDIIAKCDPANYNMQGNESQFPVNITVIYNQLISTEKNNLWEF